MDKGALINFIEGCNFVCDVTVNGGERGREHSMDRNTIPFNQPADCTGVISFSFSKTINMVEMLKNDNQGAI